MKKLVLFMMLLLPLVAMAQPQTPATPEERAKRQTERLKTELALTADQETKVNEVYLASSKKMDEARKSGQATRETFMTLRKEIQKEEDTKFKEIFSADQYTKYLAYQKKMEEERSQRRGGFGGNGQTPPQQ
jgi:Skp family chaperone for outer membrane proteins